MQRMERTGFFYMLVQFLVLVLERAEIICLVVLLFYIVCSIDSVSFAVLPIKRSH